MEYKVKLRFGSYSIYDSGSTINFEVGVEKAVSEKIYNFLKDEKAHIGSEHYSYFDAWTEEAPQSTVVKEQAQEKSVEPVEPSTVPTPKTEVPKPPVGRQSRK